MSVFLGWIPDAAAQATLGRLRDDVAAALAPTAPRHAWRTAAQWHMTLRYLGDSLDDAQRARVEAAMSALAAQTAAPQSRICGVQYWPHARVLVARIDAGEALKALLKRIEAQAQACGFTKERAQTAHVTLAYLPTRTAPAQPAPWPQPVPVHIDHIALLRTAPGAYTSLATWPLSRPLPDA